MFCVQLIRPGISEKVSLGGKCDALYPKEEKSLQNHTGCGLRFMQRTGKVRRTYGTDEVRRTY
jgi:hypothetical protein